MKHTLNGRFWFEIAALDRLSALVLHGVGQAEWEWSVKKNKEWTKKNKWPMNCYKDGDSNRDKDNR